jgi:pilus assembly protein CpaE
MSRVAITGNDALARELAAELSAKPGTAVATCATLVDSLLSADGTAPAVVVACPSVDSGEAMAFAASLWESGSDVAVLLVTPKVDSHVLRAALRARVRDVLDAKDDVESLASSVVSAVESVSRQRTSVSPEASAATALEPTVGKVITVFSPKGGVGKSVLSTNLSAAIAKELGRSVILVDLDLQFGDVAVMLQMPPSRTIFDAAQAFDRLDAEMLEGFLIAHESGLRALLAPVQPEEAESVTTGRITQILKILRGLADFVVIDTPASLSEVVLTALEQSDLILAVATMDVPSVKNTKVSLQKLQQLGFDSRTIQLVLNRADSKVWLDPHEIEVATGNQIIARIPSDRLVPRSVNKGIPVVLDSPRSAVARAIAALAREVTGV